MSEYTTGELAKLCGVTVRTVQYYDPRGILSPASLSEGGRRVYSEEELEKLKMICWLRDLGLSINDIGRVLSDEEPEKVITLLLEEQEKNLRSEIEEAKDKLDQTVKLRSALGKAGDVSPKTFGDIALKMRTNKELRQVRKNMILACILLGIIEYTTLLLWIFKGIWLPFVIGYILLVIPAAVILSKYYFRNVSYICPECRNTFNISSAKGFFSSHTPRTRKLTCPCCGKKSWCIETSRKEETNNG